MKYEPLARQPDGGVPRPAGTSHARRGASWSRRTECTPAEQHGSREIGVNVRAAQIALLLLEVAFTDPVVERAQGTGDPRDLASATVLRRAGLVYEGTMRHTVHLQDGWRLRYARHLARRVGRLIERTRLPRSAHAVTRREDRARQTLIER